MCDIVHNIKAIYCSHLKETVNMLWPDHMKRKTGFASKHVYVTSTFQMFMVVLEFCCKETFL